jgi:hypothetical protein
MNAPNRDHGRRTDGRSAAGALARSLGIAIVAVLVAGLLAEIGLRVVGLGHPVLYDNRLAYGFRPLPDQTLRRLGNATVRINSLGLRGPDVAPARPADTTRLLFLGDSVTYGGSYVDEDELLSSVAAAQVRHAGFARVETLNAGVNAWGPANVLGLIEASGGFDSNVWVVIAVDDDFRREKTRIGEVPYFNVAPRTALEEILVLGAYKLLTAYKLPKPAEDESRLAETNLERYRRIADAGRERGAFVLFVWHPDGNALRGGRQRNRAALLDMAQQLHVPSLDLATAYGTGDALYVDGLHLSVEGHRVAGQAIGRELVRLVPAAPRATTKSHDAGAGAGR